MIYCIVPHELAGKLHESLRHHFRDDPGVEVVVERRGRERRSAEERRSETAPAERGNAGEDERRRIRNPGGRRVGDRRAALLPAGEPPELPRRFRRFEGQIAFSERIEPSSESAEDADTARIVTRIQGGERELFAELYLRYFDRVYGYLRILLKDGHEAEDVAQQAFAQAFEGLPDYERRRQPFRGWLFTIVRNVAVSSLRKERDLVIDNEEMIRKLDNGGGDGREPDASILRWTSDRDFMLLIERLPRSHRQVLTLRFLVDMSSAEIAEVLGRTPNGVRQIQHRALTMLEARLRPRMREPRQDRRAPMRRWPRRAPVLRSRRFALLR